MRHNVSLTSWLAALALCIVLTSGTEPTDDQLKDLCRSAAFALKDKGGSGSEEQWQAFKPQAEALEKKCDISLITPRQIDMLFEAGGVTLDESLRRWLSPVLKAKAKGGDMPYLFRYWRYYPGANGFQFADPEIEAYKAVISAKGLTEWAKQNPRDMGALIDAAAAIPANDWQRMNMLAQVKALLDAPLSEEVAYRTVGVFNNAFAAEQIPAKDKEDIRLKVLACYERVVKDTRFNSRRKRAQAQVTYLNSPFATGKLIDHTAPALDFLWISQGTQKTLADFKGKVVVLDFWATKCAPCIESFPELAALQNHYAGKDVVILGITSPQGYFIDTPNQQTITTTGNPQKEFDLTTPYMKAMGMNWTVAYTRQDVMNTDYGVLSIPHITIIDKQGRVRYNALKAENPERIKLIDALLAE